jgi:hypothetical protein
MTLKAHARRGEATIFTTDHVLGFSVRNSSQAGVGNCLALATLR